MDAIFVGLDTGGTSNNATVLDAAGRFLLDGMVETPSLVLQGPGVAIEALVRALDHAVQLAGADRAAVRCVGLDTPGPASPGASSPRRARPTSPAWLFMLVALSPDCLNTASVEGPRAPTRQHRRSGVPHQS